MSSKMYTPIYKSSITGKWCKATGLRNFYAKDEAEAFNKFVDWFEARCKVSRLFRERRPMNELWVKEVKM